MTISGKQGSGPSLRGWATRPQDDPRLENHPMMWVISSLNRTTEKQEIENFQNCFLQEERWKLYPDTSVGQNDLI